MFSKVEIGFSLRGFQRGDINFDLRCFYRGNRFSLKIFWKEEIEFALEDLSEFCFRGFRKRISFKEIKR